MHFSSHRMGLLAGLVTTATMFLGCPDSGGQGDAGPETQDCPGTARACDSDRLCGGGFCDFDGDGDGVSKDDGDTLGCCVQLVCLSSADCQDTEKCDIRRGLCVPKNLCDPAEVQGGQCENGPCCAADKPFCEYVDGAPTCVAEPPAATDCFISAGGRPIATTVGDTEAAPAITHHNSPIQLEAIGTDANGKNVPHAVFRWSGDGVDAASGVLTAPCASGVCPVTVTATSGDASCTGVVNVYAEVTGGTRIVVVDQTTGEPIEGADVAAKVNGAFETGTTDATGAFEFSGAAENVTAYPADYQWHTVVNPPPDVIIYTAKTPTPATEDRVAGIKGTFDFSAVHTTGDIKLGLAGTAISSSITDLNFATLIGEIADYNVELEGLTDEGGQLVPLPSGLVLELGAEPIKGDYVTFGDPGKNIAWAIGGQVALARVGPIISSVSASDDVNIGAVLGGVLPFFATFDHAVITGLDLVEGDRPTPPADDSPTPFDQWPFDEHVIKPNTLLSSSVSYTMPDLPCTPGGFNAGGCQAVAADGSPFATGAVLLSGVVVPGIGLVPLGLTAGLDDPDDQDTNDQVDGKLDSDAENGPGKGEAIIDYAPPHDGLEGNLFISVAIALDINSIASTDTSGFGASIITHVTKKFGATNSFPQSFLESQGGTFTPAGDDGLGGAFVMNATGEGADFYRVNFDDGGDTEWNVWFDDAAAAFAPGDFLPAGDLVTAAARFKHADVQAFHLGSGYEQISDVAPTSFEDLFAFDGANLDNLLYYLGAWSSEACKFQGHCEDTAATAPAP